MQHYHYEPQDNNDRQFFNPFNFPFFQPNWNQPGQFPGHGGQGQFPGASPQFPGQSQFPWQGGQFPGGPTGGQSASAPQTPPPSFTPTQQQIQTKAIDPGAISSCLFRFTYVWLDRDAFWFYPTFVGRNSVAGFRWSRFRWVYFGIDLNRIQSFQCF